jgi:hypothetical protein
MYEPYERILKALNLEKQLTASQITKLLYQEEWQNENRNKAYQRIAANLQYLRKQNLLKSKSYGLIPGKGSADYFWSLRKHPIISELGYEPPRAEVHAFKYEHEKECAEVFVALALTGKLYGWKAHKRISKGIIPDRTANLQNNKYYIEVERGTQDKIASKTENYRRYFRETNEEFNVLYLVKDEKTLEDSVAKLEETGASGHYLVSVFSEFTSDPLNAILTNSFKSTSLSDSLQ